MDSLWNVFLIHWNRENGRTQGCDCEIFSSIMTGLGATGNEGSIASLTEWTSLIKKHILTTFVTSIEVSRYRNALV